MDYNCCPMSAPILVVKFLLFFFFVSPLEMMILNSIENAVVKFPNKKKKKKNSNRVTTFINKQQTYLSMISRKRQFEDDSTFNFMSPITSHPETKKLQRNKIHSEVHLKTISMMMQAQLVLQKEERLNKTSHNQQEEQVEEEQKSTYYQRPYW